MHKALSKLESIISYCFGLMVDGHGQRCVSENEEVNMFQMISHNSKHYHSSHLDEMTHLRNNFRQGYHMPGVWGGGGGALKKFAPKS